MKNNKDHRRWILITGLSGSGKTTALKILEDQGFFAIDNLPVALLPSLIQLLKKSKDSLPKIVLGMDAREKDFISSFPNVLKILKDSGMFAEIFYLDCDPKILIRRFSESRRPHPLRRKNQTLEKTILSEKTSLEPLRRTSSLIMDTSNTNVHQLKSILLEHLRDSKKPAPLEVTFLSFGFKFGAPAEADLLFDVRFLSNPFFEPRLKNRTGRAPSVQNFVMKQRDAKTFFRHTQEMLNFLIPRFQREGKPHLTIAFGCTGGKHRSVVFVEKFAKKLSNLDVKIEKIHRDLAKEAQSLL